MLGLKTSIFFVVIKHISKAQFPRSELNSQQFTAFFKPLHVPRQPNLLHSQYLHIVCLHIYCCCPSNTKFE